MYIDLEGTTVKELTQLIAIYEHGYGDEYIEHGVVDNKNSVTWKPINKSKFYQELEKQIRERITGSGSGVSTILLPPDILHYSQNYKDIVFYVPPEKRLIYFNFFKKPIGIPLPGLLFHSINNGISVYAFKRKGVPNNNTVFYNHPLPNSGCMGNVKIQLDYSRGPVSVKNQILHLYFDSTFTSENMYNAIKNFDGTAKDFYSIVSKLQKFPNKYLKNPKKIFAYDTN